MSDLKWSFKRHFVTSLLITLIAIVSDVATGGFAAFSFLLSSGLFENINLNESLSIGIIGGADGPTAFFLSGNPFNAFIISKVVLFLVLVVLFVPTKKSLSKMSNKLHDD